MLDWIGATNTYIEGNIIDIMRHFRGSRGGRSRNIPRSTVRSIKYIFNQAAASEGAGIIAVPFARGVDNATMGQTSTTDIDVPTGSKIAAFDIFMPKVNLGVASANFIHWTIQRTASGQVVINPITAGGNAVRKNILLSGVMGLGAGQNNSLHIKLRVPKKFQRIADGDTWQIVHNNGLTVSAVYMVIYKIFQ